MTYAMPVVKSVGERQICGQAEVIIEHTCKLAIYGNIRRLITSQNAKSRRTFVPSTFEYVRE